MKIPALALAATLITLCACEDSQNQDVSQNADLAPVAIEATTTRRGEITQWHFAEGLAQAQRKEFLQFEVPGRVTFIAPDETGKPLREGSRVAGSSREGGLGQLIARLDERDTAARVAAVDAEVIAARRRVDAAEAQLSQAEREFNRQRDLRDQDLSTEAEFEAAQAAFRGAEAQIREARAGVSAISAQAEEAKLGLERTSLFAPFDGVISLMNIAEGDFSAGPTPDPRDAMMEINAAVVIIDDSAFEVTLHLPPHEAALISEGQRAFVATDGSDIAALVGGASLPSVLEGEVWSVSPSVSLQRRAVVVKVRVSGAAGAIRDGELVSTWIAAADSEDTLVVPYAAVQFVGTRASVFVVDNEGTSVERRDIETGLLGIDQIEVLQGLSDGERVVVRGQHQVRGNVPVRLVTAGADQ